MKKQEMLKTMINLKNDILKGQQNANYYERIYIPHQKKIIKSILYLINDILQHHLYGSSILLHNDLTFTACYNFSIDSRPLV